MGNEKSHWDLSCDPQVACTKEGCLSNKILIVAVRKEELRVGGNETKATDRSVHQGVKAGHLMNDEIRTLFCLSNATFSN